MSIAKYIKFFKTFEIGSKRPPIIDTYKIINKSSKYHYLNVYNFTLTDLKNIAKQNDITIPAYIRNKKDVFNFCINILRLKHFVSKIKNKWTDNKHKFINYKIYRTYNIPISTDINECAVRIQKLGRQHIFNKFRKSLGPAYLNFSKSTNPNEVFDFIPIDEIDFFYFFSFETNRNNKQYIYTFDIRTIIKMLETNKLINPYDNKIFEHDVLQKIFIRIRLNKVIGKSIF